MKKSNNQTGSTHIFIIIVLVFVVLGLLGFVFWQNFVNKTTTSHDTKTSQTNSTISVAYINLDRFGYKLPYDSSHDTLTITNQQDLGDGIYSYSITSQKLADACKALGTNNGTDFSIGSVTRYPSDTKTDASELGQGKTWAEYWTGSSDITTQEQRTPLVSPLKSSVSAFRIENYVYVSQGPQQGCGGDESTQPEKDANLLGESTRVSFVNESFFKLTKQ